MRDKTPFKKKVVLSITLNNIWWWGSSSGDLGCSEHPFIGINLSSPTYLLSLSFSLCKFNLIFFPTTLFYPLSYPAIHFFFCVFTHVSINGIHLDPTDTGTKLVFGFILSFVYLILLFTYLFIYFKSRSTFARLGTRSKSKWRFFPALDAMFYNDTVWSDTIVAIMSQHSLRSAYADFLLLGLGRRLKNKLKLYSWLLFFLFCIGYFLLFLSHTHTHTHTHTHIYIYIYIYI